MRTRLQQIRGLILGGTDPYEGADLGNAQRLGALLWGLVLVLVVVILPISPPDSAIDGAGWAVAGVLIGANLALIALLRRERLASWHVLLAVSYVAVAAIGVLQWLAGGIVAPYDRLLLLPVLFAAALHPLRLLLPLLGFTFLVLAAPYVYDTWESKRAASDLVGFAITAALGVMANLLMSGVRNQRLAHAREEAEARHEARIDSLTGLYNRRAFNEDLEREVSRARRLRMPLSVALVDLENFKEVNDRWGYAEGDRCLREVAETMQASLRRPDLGFRWGGDEFALILSGASEANYDRVGERITRAISERCHRPDGEPIVARFAAAELTEDLTPEELVESVGMALTAAKS